MLLMFSARVFTLNIVLSTVVVLSGSDQVDVCTSTGRVRGETRVLDGRVYEVFLGIPYAEPPTGHQRFRAPVPKVSWEGTLDAVNYGPSCPQDIEDVSRYYPNYVVRIPKSAREISEDCLTLNVFSPVRRDRIGNVAVMFWIHGGSCETGQGSGYDPSALASRGDVIVVTINYRLNVFGFLCTDDENAPGNYGLLDQQLALQWVHDNIGAFGGDPTRVTLFGQSAGGATAMAHLSAPGSRPLFHRVIAHSGIFAGSAGLESVGKQLKEYAKRIALKAGCDHSGNLLFDTHMIVDCLRSKSAQVVLKAGLEVAKEVIIPMLWLAVIDGNFYPRQTFPPKAISFSQYDIIAGITSNDGSPLLELLPFIIHKQVNQSTGLSRTDFDRLVQFFTLSDETSNNQFRSLAIYHEYRDWSVLNRTLDNLYQITNVMLDVNFLYGLNLVLGSIYGGANSRRMFVFDHRSTPRVKYPWLNGAPHSEELSYVFGLPFNGSGIGSLFTDDERALSDRMITYWTNIAKTG
ncbi:acetylcholinesterase-like [Asterias amurensis]|uniref:acetylcholinesterase-like n=1 Tax=Asterias amurensis TaxID=7602 RepID=UPI003AB69A33